MSSFADDNFTIRWHSDMGTLVRNLENSLTNITKWLRDSGLVVNSNKTEVCLFSKRDTASITITLDNDVIHSTKTINVLGVIFDSRLTWGPQITNVVTRSSKALNALRLIGRFFSKREKLQLVTSNFYSILYYNSEVWYLHTLKQAYKNMILSASARALRYSLKNYDPFVSHINLHLMANRATPDQLMTYKTAPQLYKTFNNSIPITEWTHLTENIIFTSRQQNFVTSRNNNLKISSNKMSNRFWHLNGKISLDWLNLSFNSFKINCKKLLLNQI